MPIQSFNRIELPGRDAAVLSTLARSSLGVPYVPQTEDNWCWAACGEMLFRKRGEAQFTQCYLASQEFDLVCCPSPRAPDGCDQGCWPQDSYPDHGMPVKVYPRQLSIEEVRAELDAGRPVQVCFNWTGSDTTHVVLIVGEPQDGRFQVLDPSPLTSGTGARDFDYIRHAYGKGEWIYSFTFGGL